MAVKVYNVPNGPANLATLFPAVDFTNVAEYYVEVLDSTNTVIATTTMNEICGCEDDGDCFRIHFLNAIGSFDSISFKKIEVLHEPKSDSFQRPTSYPLVKTDHSIGRFNVKSNETVRACTIQYYEEDMEWLRELFDAPVAYIEQAAAQGQSATYTPIVIIDKKNVELKQDDRYVYQVEIEFKFSHERFIIRN